MNKILIIDDDSIFVQNFANEANAKNITVIGKKSLEDLKNFIPKYENQIAAIVLDIKCLLTNDQAKEDSDFIGSALTYLNTTIPHFPRFILTGDESEFQSLKRFYRTEQMFIKSPPDISRLLLQLEECIVNSSTLKIKRENIDVFKVFETKLIAENKESIVINILKNYNEKKPQNFKGIIGDIREIHEEVYRSLNVRNKAVVPDKYINSNGSPSFKNDFYKHLTGNPDHNNKHTPTTPVYQDSTILSQTKFIHSACSEYLHSTSNTGFSISSYTLKSLINSLMEIIIWSKSY